MMDRSKGNKRNWILVWEDGFCNFSACAAGAAKDTRGGPPFFPGAAAPQQPSQRGSHSDDESEAMSPELFFKMSHEVYNYGEGLMGKVAADSSHKWVYREPVEHEISFLSPWQGSLDPHPRTWEAQFKSGIQTIAVVAVQEGVLQLGSTKKIMEDLNFVLHMQRRFNYLQSIPGVFVPHPMSCAGKKRSGSEGSSPTDRGHWMATSEAASATQLTARSIDQFLSPRIGPQLWRSSSDTSVLGVKRPPDSEPLSLSFKDYSYMSPTEGFQHRPECPSPPKSLNTGHTSPQGGATSPTIPNLLPSMSSLQALLSKLPSVTPTERAEGFDVNGGIVTGSFSNRPPVSRPVVNKTSGAKDSAVAPTSLPKPKAETEPLPGNLGATTTSSSPSSGNSDVASAEHTSDDTEGHQTGTSQCKGDSQKFSSFLDTFDNLADFGTLHDSLENGDSYNSFLSEIYS
ncbi:hypothetical protein M758_4G037800 [Ceratodon purpureus]|nr:hypothetical protein M758_4G037800 [Ceratodon purpureus]